MSLRAPPGIQLSTGRLRVDAARAIVKLREYQLVDRMAWVLEAIRGAVALGATTIELTGDANDVWLRWTGTPLPAEDLARLFDELVSPEPTADRHGVRLLASAINSALGTNPAYVELTAIDDASAARVVYTPELLDAPEHELGEAPLRELAVQTVATPPTAGRGMLLRLRRRTTLDVVQNFFRGEPPELRIARAHCHTITVPLRVGGHTFEQDNLGDDILRIPLGNDLQGFVAIVDPDTRTDSMGVVVEIAERGVVLERFEDAFGVITPLHPMPLRVVIDAPKLPTNASRSEVRRDQHPISTGLARARELFPRVVAALVSKLRKETPDPRARTAAIALVATYVAGGNWKDMAAQLAGPIATLADCPLLLNVVGEMRPIRAPWAWSAVYHDGTEPLPRELAPWVETILWVPPGDAARRLVPAPVRELMRSHLRFARREMRIRRRFLRHARREAHVIDTRTPLVRAKLGAGIANSCVPDAVFENLSGEVCLYPAGGGSLTILLEGRELEKVTYDSAFGFAAVIEHRHIRPDAQYRKAIRDLEFSRVERAMRAQVLRAIEALAANGLGAAPPDGIELPRAHDAVKELTLVRHGIELALDLGAIVRAPLASIGLWPTSEGELLTLDELRSCPKVGITRAPPREQDIRIGVPLVHVRDNETQRLLVRLLPNTVTYSPEHLAHTSSAHTLAIGIGAAAHYLELQDNELHGVIAAAQGTSRIVVFHRGIRLAERTFTSTLVTCAIVVEASHVIPSGDWISLADDRGLLGRDFRAWQEELVRAAARALVGERPASLHGPSTLEVTSELARALFKALTRTDPRELLDDDLVAKLRTQPLFSVNGKARLHSIDELAIAFPASLPYLPERTEPLADFSPLVASHELAHGIAALLGYEPRDARVEIETRRLDFARDLRIAEHREKPIENFALPADTVALELATMVGRATIAIGRHHMELRFLVEGRLFQTVILDDLPLNAVIDLPVTSIDRTFEAVPADLISSLTSTVRERAPALLVAAAAARPELAGDVDAMQLVAMWTTRRGYLPTAERALLAARVVFATVQNTREQLPETHDVPTAAWSGTWLPPADGEPPDELDRPVFALPQGAMLLRTFMNAIAKKALHDVTHDIERLQRRRQVARGLVSTPRAQTPPSVTRSLATFGDVARSLGAGEIGLVNGPSFLRVHRGGELRELVPIDVVPTVHVAIDEAFIGDSTEFLASLRTIARNLAHIVLRTVPQDEMSYELCAILRRAVLARAVPSSVAGDVKLFPTLDREWLSIFDVQAQIDRFGVLWAVTNAARVERPLDGNRRVFLLTGNELAFATEHSWPVIDATKELELDQLTRRNLARPRPATLQLPSTRLLATQTIEGDGVHSARGMVGILDPANALGRGIHAHRELHPFDAAPDPCAWPTVAVVDDARLVPDRTWSSPVDDARWLALKGTVLGASEAAWRRLLLPPPSALTSLELTPSLLNTLSVRLPTNFHLRGVLWLERPSVGGSVTIHQVPELVAKVGIAGLGGRLYVYASHKVDTTIYKPLFEEVYHRLVRQLADAGPLDDDLVQAHVAEALALRELTPAHVPTFTFSCFPTPLSSDELATLIQSPHPLPLVDDGTETYRVLYKRFGSRKPPPTPAPSPIAQPLPVPLQPSRSPLMPVGTPLSPKRRHPFADLVDVVHYRAQSLGVHMPEWTFRDDRAEPLVRYRDSTLEIAARNPQALAIAATHQARSPWASDAIDLLVAHVITVLNDERAAVTDGAEAAALAKLLG